MSLPSRRSALLLGLGLLPACAPTTDNTPPSQDGSDGTTSSSPDTDDGSTSAVDTTSGSEDPTCGNGEVEMGEECDDGEANADTAACTSSCQAATCGDGLVYEGVEDCDDGNEVDDDSCANDCSIGAACGNGMIDEGEECDDGAGNSSEGACLPDCTASICGDGEVQSEVEDCDDGNDDNNDACTELCAQPTCGDGFPQTVNSELCDDGDEIEGDECNGDCTTAGLWTNTYNGPADNNDEVHGVAIDSGGSVIAAGVTFDGGQGDDIWVRKYAPDGSVTWTQTYHGVTAETAWAVATDGDDILVAGGSYTLDEGIDAWIRRYNPGGSTDWTQTYNGGANEDDEALGIAVDGSGNVLAVGYTTTAGAQRDIWIRKYDAGGAPQWTRTVSGAGGQNDEGHGIAADPSGNVLVTGYVWAGAESRDLWVRKYNPSGTEQWTRTHGSAGGENDEGNGVAADSAGNVIVTGFETTATGRDVWVRKYDASGTEQWTQTYNAPQDGSDSGRGVAVDPSDEIVVVATVYRGAQLDNIWVRKYDASGSELWTSTYNSDAFGSDVGTSVATDGDGNVAVGGYETRQTDLGEGRNTWVRRILQ